MQLCWSGGNGLDGSLFGLALAGHEWDSTFNG
jgi:hypothetical protein